MSTSRTLNCYFYSIEVQVKQEQGQPRHEKKRRKNPLIFASALSLNNNIMSRSCEAGVFSFNMALISFHYWASDSGKGEKMNKENAQSVGEKKSQTSIYLVGWMQSRAGPPRPLRHIRCLVCHRKAKMDYRARPESRVKKKKQQKETRTRILCRGRRKKQNNFQDKLKKK